MIASKATAPAGTKPIPGGPGYRAGSDGRIWSGLSGHWRELKRQRTKDGNLIVTMQKGGKQRSATVARLVLYTWSKTPREMGQRAFFFPDPDRSNCSADNLRWASPGTSLLGRKRTCDFWRSGEQAGSSKLKEADVIQIRTLARGEFSMAEIADRFGVSASAVKSIINGRTWGHLVDPLGPIKVKPRGFSGAKLTRAEVVAIRQNHANKELAIRKALAAEYGLKLKTVTALIRGDNWKIIPSPRPSTPREPHASTHQPAFHAQDEPEISRSVEMTRQNAGV